MASPQVAQLTQRSTRNPASQSEILRWRSDNSFVAAWGPKRKTHGKPLFRSKCRKALMIYVARFSIDFCKCSTEKRSDYAEEGRYGVDE
ncbi:hypothetical protein TNIN_231901 [Trichonephila inaurata madagascariensis]|uniref:Uncharacterized protein n=1 Tax=Trichonephila inaurata madagascariensis TaxID=2747483 RepID=A0A8X6WZW3_9ARAC|nr:hypothetical protein TNIN_231901 [Trichonephila inaurata madagascariensis]